MLTFSHPEKKTPTIPVVPVFMPFAGCEVRCVFCSQTAQTGMGERSLAVILQELDENLLQREKKGQSPVEIAFYGGTFTALPQKSQMDCLALAQKWRLRGMVERVRCSTRPDRMDASIARFLHDEGVTLVELGVQSFSATALLESRRHYTEECIIDACDAVHETGLELGIQLMPGLPGGSVAISEVDIQKTIAQRPHCVRLYPCLVFAQTPLAKLWAERKYHPLSLEDTVPLLASACLDFWEHDIRVIRMGVAPEPTALQNLLAGPFHPSLGNMVRGLALFIFISRKLNEYGGAYPKKTPPASFRLHVPSRYQGDFWGFKGSLREGYAKLKIEEVVFHEAPHFSLEEIGESQ